jgi:hypothetical protein
MTFSLDDTDNGLPSQRADTRDVAVPICRGPCRVKLDTWSRWFRLASNMFASVRRPALLNYFSGAPFLLGLLEIDPPRPDVVERSAATMCWRSSALPLVP